MTDDLIPREAPFDGAAPEKARWRPFANLGANDLWTQNFLAGAGRSQILRLLFGALVLMTPVIANGRPFPFTDSATYFQAGYYVLQFFFSEAGLPMSDFSRSYLAARSPAFGLLITAIEYFGTMWLIVALQALAAAKMLDLCARAIHAARARLTYAILIGALTIGSALPLFVGFIMPDLSAAFAIMAIGLLVFYPECMARWERVLIWLFLAASLSFHMTHVLVVAVAAPTALAMHWFLKLPGRFYRARTMAAALLVGIGAWGLFAAVNATNAKPFYSPPFLTARILADGPGRVYLRAACAKNEDAYALCAFRKLPFAKSDEILWSWSKARGVFAVAPHPTRLKLIAEQGRFVLNAFLYDPLAQIGASLKDFGEQLITVGVDEGFRLDAHYWMTYPPDFYLKTMAIRAGLCPEPRKKCPARLPLPEISMWLSFTTTISALYLLGWTIAAFAGGGARNDPEKRLFIAFGSAILFAVIANAAVCGVLSGAFPRYQARVAWLIPALAILAECRFGVFTPLIRARRAARPR